MTQGHSSFLCSVDDDQGANERGSDGYYVMISAGELVDGDERQVAGRVRTHAAPALHALIIDAILKQEDRPADSLLRQLLDQLDTVKTVDASR